MTTFADMTRDPRTAHRHGLRQLRRPHRHPVETATRRARHLECLANLAATRRGLAAGDGRWRWILLANCRALVAAARNLRTSTPSRLP
jgi:hypothetical protein